MADSEMKRNSEITAILTNLSQSLDKLRDKKTGMWYQVTDKGDKAGIT